MIMFRFNQLYIGAVTVIAHSRALRLCCWDRYGFPITPSSLARAHQARSHVETTLIALRTVAVHIRGMASPKAALWVSRLACWSHCVCAHSAARGAIISSELGVKCVPLARADK